MAPAFGNQKEEAIRSESNRYSAVGVMSSVADMEKKMEELEKRMDTIEVGSPISA